jgi:glycosyltransferase involved in cell wall biosynthesis
MNEAFHSGDMMTSRPLISILTPVFNQRSYIEQTVSSVLNQTYQNWEWIIVDDGSTDGTGEIIRSFKDGRIRYACQERAGLANLTKTYNRALTMCAGSYIAMLDGDDYWPDYKLALQVENFNSPDIVLSYGESILVNKNGKKILYRNLPADVHIATNNPVGSSLKLFLLKRDCFLTNSTVMVKKGALLSIGGFIDVKGLTQDFPTWTRLSLEGRFAANPLCLGYWRRHFSSTSYAAGPEAKMEDGINYLREFAMLNKQKLFDLGFIYDKDMLEENWRRLNPYLRYYSKAIVAMASGSFNEAKSAFKKFLEKDASLKQEMIYFLIVLSSILRFDLVNPLAFIKTRLEKIICDYHRDNIRDDHR